ncbi:MAG: AAA family ATPase [Aquificaceae bacterium]|nr:AAA family ATPase [Aquificaceae bacterium]
MGFLQRLIGKKEREKAEVISIETPKGELRLWPEDALETDPDTRIEEFWVDAMGVSEDGYWLLVGRRHGVFQLYDWSGKLHRLPSRPPAQVVTEILFKGSYLALLTPPYLVVYLLEDRKNPQSWKSFRTTQEGVRASTGLDISGNLLAYGVVGERVYVIDISGGFGSEGLDFKTVFSYSSSDIGELRHIKFLGPTRIILSGNKGVALYDLGGNLIGRVDHASGRGVLALKEGLLLSEGGNLFLYDLRLEGPTKNLSVPMKISSMDISPDGDFLFLADEEENRMGLIYLPEFKLLQVFDGFGYSIIRVSPDGNLYTCSYRDEEDKRFYGLRTIRTNLVDFLYEPERQSQMVKRAEEELKKLKEKLKRLREGVEPSEMEEYKRLLSMDAPIRGLRDVIEKAKRAVEDAKFEAFIRDIESRMSEGQINGEDLAKVESLIRLEKNERLKKLQSLKEHMEEYFNRGVREQLQKVQNALKLLKTEDIRDFEGIAEVKEAREFFHMLPKELKEQAQTSLQKLMQEHILQSKRQKYQIRIEDSRVFFGSEEFPRFSGERRRLKWRLRVEDRVYLKDRLYAKIAFEREDGILVEPKRYTNLIPQEEMRSLPSWARRYMRHLNGLLSNEPFRTPLFVSYEETPWFVKNLQRFTSLVKEQLLFLEGIVILEGDAGVGKNFLVEVFSALTRRPLYIIPCNSKMEKEDLTFVYEFDARKGTRRVYSDLVKALQTPGAVIYFDEINTLPPGMVKLFNPLFDYRRYLTLPTGEAVKAHRDVIFVGGMNPQNYLGVSELPQDIKSRADILFIDYPPFEEEGGLYSPDEAMILKDYIPQFSSLSAEEFLYLWHGVVNGLKIKELENQEVFEELIWKLFELLKIANMVRKAYRAYQTQQSEEPVDFVFSVRDTIRCARRLNKYASVKMLVMDTVLPKVSSPLEKEILKSLIERV